MKIKALRTLGDKKPLILDGYEIIFIEKDSVPIVVACELGAELGGCCYVGHARDDDFNAMLQHLGLDTLVIAEDGKNLLTSKPWENLPRVDKPGGIHV